jgi:hypothetical protein
MSSYKVIIKSCKKILGLKLKKKEIKNTMEARI